VKKIGKKNEVGSMNTPGKQKLVEMQIFWHKVKQVAYGHILVNPSPRLNNLKKLN